MLRHETELVFKYFKTWRLQPNASKTETSSFHLNNSEANTSLNIFVNGQYLKHNQFPTYLGVTLDRPLTYKPHIDKLCQKLKTRNNLIHRLAGDSWGASARTSVLSLVYSTAEYCCSSWLNSSHCHLVDVQLNNSMRIISGSVKYTPLEWLSVMSNIAPPRLRRQRFLNNTIKKCDTLEKSLLYNIRQDLPNIRLKRKPPWTIYDRTFNIDL